MFVQAATPLPKVDDAFTWIESYMCISGKHVCFCLEEEDVMANTIEIQYDSLSYLFSFDLCVQVLATGVCRGRCFCACFVRLHM